MYRTKYIAFLLFILLSSCFQRREVKQFLYQYADARLNFPHEYIDHFPDVVSPENTIGLYLVPPGETYALDMCYLFYAIKVDSIGLSDLKSLFVFHDINPIQPNDTSLIVVGDTIDYSHRINGFPIPSFISIEWDLGINQVRLPDTFSLYLIKAEPGKYLIDDHLGSGKNLPTYWTHGYTKGIAVNEKSMDIIYWVALW